MYKLYFSCPKFTVLLVTEGQIIVEAAPIVRRFEGQTIGALTSWAQSRFDGPIIVQKLPRPPNEVGDQPMTTPGEGCSHRCSSPSSPDFSEMKPAH